MVKRLVSLLLVAIMSFSLISITVAADSLDLTDKIITKLLQFTPESRNDIYKNYVKLYLSYDSGVDSLVKIVEGYAPGSTGIIDISPIFEYTDKETAIKSLNSIKIINEDLRSKYLNAFDERESLQLSSNAMQALSYLITKACNEHSGLSTLMEQDGITAGVIAKQLKAIAEINDGKPILTDNTSNNDFKIYSLSKYLKSKIDKFLSDNSMGSSSDYINTYLDKLNNLTADDKANIKILGEEIGFYTPKKDVVPSGSSGGTSYQSDDISIKYNVISDSDVSSDVKLDGATLIEVALYKNNEKQPFGNLDKDYTIKIPVTDSNVMAYKVTDVLAPIKYNINVNNELYIRLNSTGYYGIKIMPKHFTDANGWGSTYIESLYNRGIINGIDDGIFAPDNNITREEFVKLIVELFGFDDDKYYTNFDDVNKDEWYYKYVAIAYKNNIINGIGDNRFGIGMYITRQDICKIIYNVIKAKGLNLSMPSDEFIFKDDIKIDSYAKDSVKSMQTMKIVSGDENGFFNPKDNATRQDAAKIVYGVLEMYIKDAIH